MEDLERSARLSAAAAGLEGSDAHPAEPQATPSDALCVRRRPGSERTPRNLTQQPYCLIALALAVAPITTTQLVD